MEEKYPTSLLEIQHQWPLIARDIVLMLYPVKGSTKYTGEDIAKNYGLTQADFCELLRLPIFCDIVKTEFQRFKSLGPDAGYKMRVEALVADVQERLYLRIKRGSMDDKSAIQYLGMLMRSIGLDEVAPAEKPVATAAAAQANTAVNISFNIPKLPNNKKLNHLLNQKQTNVIDYIG